MKQFIQVIVDDYRSEGFTRNDWVLGAIGTVVFNLIIAAV